MQNRYVGDVADFGKHGLLRFLSGMMDMERPEPKLRIGLAWYLFHDQRHGADRRRINYDGRHTTYLERTPEDDRQNYRDCDPELWEKLRDLVFRDARCVHCAEDAEVLPEDTLYHSVMFYYPSSLRPRQRREYREQWFGSLLQATEGADLACVDPDNGISDPDRMYRAEGPKFVYLSDLQALWNRGQSLVVYHHLGMVKGGAEVMVADAAARLKDGLGVDPIALVFHRGTARVFFVIVQPDHRDVIGDRVHRMLASPWGQNGHFERMALPAPDDLQ